MAYTLYLYKEFPSKSGKTIRLEIFERDYAGSAIELEALSPTPVTLTTDNTNNSVFMPIIKTYLGVNIKDTEQIDYTRLFTPDATKFKVIIKVNGTTEWAGYLTPDSFSQSLQYRSEINLIARDNLGMLSEFTYSSGNTFGTIRSLINASLSVIGFQGTLEYRVKKVDENAVNVLDGYVPLRAYTGKTYQEVLETLLTGIGCQLRYVGGNKYAIFDIADLKGYGDTITSQDFLFIDQSGMLELIPAWKDITISQDYLLAEEIISNRLAEDDYIFRSNQLFNVRVGKQDDPIQQVLLPTYDLLGAGWGGTLAIPSPYDFIGEKPSNILLPIIELPVITAPYIEISNIVPPYNGGLEIQFNVHNAFLVPDEALYTQGILSLTDQLPTNAVNYGGAGVRLGYTVILESGGKIYELGNTWEEIASKLDAQIRDFAIDKPVTEEGVNDVIITGSLDVPCSITIMSLLDGGTLSLRLYGYNIYGTLYRRDFFDCIVRISDLKFVLKNDEPSGRTTTTVIDANYNLRGDISLALGEVPASKMNYFSMLGGIYRNLSPYYPPMTGFQRTEAIEYHLSELVGREIAHHYKTQRKKLSGNIINSENFAAMPSFAKPFTDGTLTYALNYGSLDFRNEVMSVELIEVEDYETDDFTFIDAEIDTGGGESLGSGETEFIQWSAAGNAKRLYQLDTATPVDAANAYTIIDKVGLTEAKKISLANLSNYSNGVVIVPTIVDNGNGSVTISTGTYSLSTNALGIGLISQYEIGGGTFTLTDLTQNYIVADYNDGTPILRLIEDVLLINETTIIPVFSIFRNGNVLHTQWWDSLGNALTNKLHQSIVKTQRYRRESGLSISEYGTRNLNLTSGRVWVGAVPVNLDAVLTATDNLSLWYHSAGNWTNTIQASYNNTQYDNGTNLVELTNNRYAVNWIYRGVESQKHIYVVLGMGDYSLSDAQGAVVPALPAAISSHAVLVAKLIVQKNAATAISIQSAFNAQFSFSAPAAHNDLTGIQGGITNEYYHLSSAQHTIATQSATASRDGYLTSTDWITFNGKAPATGGTGYIQNQVASAQTADYWISGKAKAGTLIIPQTAPTLASGETAIYSLDSGFSGETPSGAGTLTSVALTMPTGFSVSGSPITESGTFGVTFASGYRMFTETEIGNKIESSLIGAANGVTPLDSGGKVALQYLPSTLLKYMGVWNASTNSPTLTSPDTNRKGQVWNVSVAGTQFGLDFKLGDWLIYNDSGVAEKSDNSDDVTSVNGYTGAVTLKTSDIAEQTNLYYTDARVKTYADTLYTPIAHGQITSGNPHGTTAADVGALALTGGTITGAYNALKIKRNSSNPALISYENTVGVLGLIGVNTSSQPIFLMPDLVTTYNFWHSGNSNLNSVDWTAAKLSSTTLLLPQAAPTLASGEMAIYGLESGFSGETPSGAGSVTSISMVVPTGLSVTPTTITESGTFTISYASGYSIPTNTKQSEWDNAYTLRHNAVTLGTANGLSLSTQELSLGLASTSTNGALSSTDWNTFNGKQAKLIGTGASSLVRVNTSGVIAYDDSTYLTGNQTITLSGIITGSGTTAITTAIADGALSIAKTNGLQTALDGKLSTTGKAADSDLLDGHDSTYFQVALTNPVTGTGTSGYLPRFTGASTIGNSSIYSDGTNACVGSVILRKKFHIDSDVSDYALKVSGEIDIATHFTGIVFGLSGYATTYEKAAIMVRGTSGEVQPEMHFLLNNTADGSNAAFSDAALSLYPNKTATFYGAVTIPENINTNLRIPKVAPTSPTSGEYYFYIVE